ncbi:MAG: PIG-L family deacetylase [Cyanobacteria bacterium]|nr:PIG-L family deacetylase [Cyanobacteriota bacterium]
MNKKILLTVAALSALGTMSQGQAVGAAEAWLKINKLRNTVSVMHITAHPDDEHGGVLAKLSHGDGARVTLLTLNRGESGDNAIGPQLFDALGLIRSEELLAADRYYGVDQQYFTSVVDYGFSKTLEESMSQWGRDTVLRDVVRIIRMERPMILLSRFRGNARDGHGNHQAAGLMAREAFRAAGDASRYPEQLKEGLRPWQPMKLFIGGVRENEEWTVRIDSGEYSPILGDSYANIARRGLSFQRSQNGGSFTPSAGPSYSYYVEEPKSGALHDVNATFFDGLPTTMERTFGAAGQSIDEAVQAAVNAFSISDPSASAKPLAEGLRLTRLALAAAIGDADRMIFLQRKELQFQDAINASVGAALTAVTNPPVMSTPVAGQTFNVDARLEIRGTLALTPSAPVLTGAPGWKIDGYRVTVGDDAAVSTKPYYFRKGLQESRYTLIDATQFGKPNASAPLIATASYTIDGVPVEIRESVKRREAKLPYGEVVREVRTVPRLAVSLTPSNAIVPLPGQPLRMEVTVLHNGETASTGQLTLKLPAGWKSEPASQAFTFARAGERASYSFAVKPASIDAKTYTVEAVATAAGKEYREGYELIDHRDLGLQYLYRPSIAEVRGVNVSTVAGLKVGYVMGIGDSVPQGLQQLGAQVTLLDERALASADLSAFDTIMTGTRAYAVREDLRTYNSRLLDYVKAGGNMIVLYNTQELVPNTFAPFPGDLPRNAEEVSEENSPVTILAPSHQSFTWPNKITAADFDGWIEQRGSKFFTKWDAAYTPMISTFDKGQAPQSGGWLTAKVGKGNWTYFAYALHRQLPYGVPGAYRITANLLALNKQPVGGKPGQ